MSASRLYLRGLQLSNAGTGKCTKYYLVCLLCI